MLSCQCCILDVEIKVMEDCECGRSKNMAKLAGRLTHPKTDKSLAPLEDQLKLQSDITEHVSASVKIYRCDQCDAFFQHRKKLQLHKRSFNHGVSEIDSTDIDPYKCQHCEKRFTTIFELCQHVRSHTVISNDKVSAILFPINKITEIKPANVFFVDNDVVAINSTGMIKVS